MIRIILESITKDELLSDTFSNEPTNSSRAFSLKTGIPMYDSLIDGITNTQTENLQGEIRWISPKEFLTKCADDVNMSLDDYVFEIIDDTKYQDCLDKRKSGDKAPLPYLKLVNDTLEHEGRHRAMVAKDLGDKYIPILVITERDE